MTSIRLSSPDRAARRTRRALASFGALVAAAVIFHIYHFDAAGLYGLSLGSLVLAAWLVHREGVAGQLVARAILLAHVADGVHEQIDGGPPLWPVAAGLSLLAAGDIGLGGRPKGAVEPAARRGLVAPPIVVALALAQYLITYGWAYLRWQGPGAASRHAAGSIMVGCAALLGAAAFGLYRARAWGLLAACLGGVLVAGLMLSNALRLMPYSLTLAYQSASLALALVALSSPLLWAALAGRAPPPRLAALLGRGLPRWAVAAVVVSSIAHAVEPELFWPALRAITPASVTPFAEG